VAQGIRREFKPHYCKKKEKNKTKNKPRTENKPRHEKGQKLQETSGTKISCIITKGQ
jgi:hypothetical protein